MDSEQPEKVWLPIECNPEVFNLLALRLGFPLEKFSFTDVFALDDEVWTSMMPQPVVAVILAFPIKEMHKGLRETIRSGLTEEIESKVCFIKQQITNACGTVATLHALLNLADHIDSSEFVEDSFLAKFTKWENDGDKKTSEARSKYLIASEELELIHLELSQEGSSEVVECTSCHFMTFVAVGDTVYELDGRECKPG
mmetsp:Transcript_12210/g.13932  ORF Transcript_12210/g.13932 Transcript_12210/m.13932 type:complete len:198 (+) Transcript_12210:67-660(+)